MRTFRILAVSLFVVAPAAADDEPFAAHVGPRSTRQHTHERAGTCGTARFTTSGVSCKETGGWIGGNRVAHATPGTAVVPNPGVFGWDWVGRGRYPGRIFLGFGADKPRQELFQPKYNTDPKK